MRMSDVFKLSGSISIDTSDATQKINQLITLLGNINTDFGGINIGGTTGTNGTNGGTGNNNPVATLGHDAENATRQTNTLGNAMSVMWGNLATQGVNAMGRIGRSFLQTGWEYNMNMERWTATFASFVTGSEGEVNAFMEEVKQFAKDTPLSLAGTVETAVSMMASGIDSSNIIETLHMLGDLAIGDTQKMKSIGKAYTDVMAKDALQGEEMRQFVNAGIPIYKLLMNYYASDAGGNRDIDLMELKRMQKDYEISGEDVHNALMMATQEGGMYHDTMNRIMGTTYGQQQKLEDTYEQVAGKLMEGIVKLVGSDIFPRLVEILDGVLTWLNDNEEALDTLTEALGLVANALLSLLGWVLSMIDGIDGGADALTSAINEYNESLAAMKAIKRSDYESEWMYNEAIAAAKERTNLAYSNIINNANMTNASTLERLLNGRTMDEFMEELATSYSQYLPLLLEGGGRRWLPDVSNGSGSTGGGGNSGFNFPAGSRGFMENILATYANLPEMVAAAVMDGFSNVTVVGNVTTGNMVLDTGILAGQLAPKLDLRFGTLANRGKRG